MRRILTLLPLLFVLSLACTTLAPTQAPPTAVVDVPSTATGLPDPTDAPTTAPPTTAPTAAATANTPGSTPETAPEATDLPTVAMDPAIAAQMDQIQSEVVELRGMQPNGEFTRALLTPETLHQKVLDDFLADYSAEEASDDVRVLAALGLLEPGFDLMNFYLELYSEQIAGYYDHETQEMYVVQGEGFGGPERMTYAHEYIHALQDQTYDIDEGLDYNDDSCEADSERCAAIQALIEGDATLSEYLWYFSYATEEDQQQVDAFYDTLESPVYDSAPPFMKEDFIFPYSYGLTFTLSLWQEGGWPAVDAAYRNLPVSTEQILHPELYPDETPFSVVIPLDITATLGEGWRELDSGVMGEWYTFLILARSINPDAQVDDDTAFAAAAGWGGDAYQVFYNDATGQTVLVMLTSWESAGERAEFVTAFQQYGDSRFGVPAALEGDDLIWAYDGGASGLYLDVGVSTIWIFGPDAATIELIADALAVR